MDQRETCEQSNEFILLDNWKSFTLWNEWRGLIQRIGLEEKNWIDTEFWNQVKAAALVQRSSIKIDLIWKTFWGQTHQKYYLDPIHTFFRDFF